MKVLLFLLFIGVCVYFIAGRWYATITQLKRLGQSGTRQLAYLKGQALGTIWLGNAVGLALSAIYFYDRDVSPFFWLMVILAVNGLAILALYEFFPKLKERS